MKYILITQIELLRSRFTFILNSAHWYISLGTLIGSNISRIRNFIVDWKSRIGTWFGSGFSSNGSGDLIYNSKKKKFFSFTFLYVGTITYTLFNLGNIFGDSAYVVLFMKSVSLLIESYFSWRLLYYTVGIVVFLHGLIVTFFVVILSFSTLFSSTYCIIITN